MLPADREQVRRLWREAASEGRAFVEPGWLVSAADNHNCAPSGWVGVVRLEDSVILATPDSDFDYISAAVRSASTPHQLVDLVEAERLLGPFVESLGPARLYYGSRSATPAAQADTVVGPIAAQDPLVTSILSDVSAAERGESDIEGTTSGLFVALDDQGKPGAACGWSEWPGEIAHIGVLTARSKRRKGLAELAANAALRAAVQASLLPQWRAAENNSASQRLANALGLTEFGAQLSFRRAPQVPANR